LEQKHYKDDKNSLFWELKTSKNKRFEYTIEEAYEYADWLNAQKHGGFDDWRVPTLEELKSTATIELFDYTGDYRAWRAWYEGVKEFAPSGFFAPDIFCEQIGKDGWYWSSTKKSDNEHYLVNFKEGNINFHDKEQSFYVRCVRG
jgi:hypothetical protein